MTTIEWLCAAQARTLQDLEQSNLASVRLRTALGIRAAHGLGMKNLLSDGRATDKAGLAVVGKVDYVSDPGRPARWLQRLRQLKAAGARVIVDYTDHHLSAQTPAADFYRDALALADTILASSLKLCEHVLAHTGRQAIMIDDPIEVPLQAPMARSHALKTLLWFGHASNLPYLFEFLLDRYRSSAERRLIVMTNLHPLPDPYMQALNAPHLQGLEINVVPWSLQDMQAAASLSDVCIIPAGVADPRKSGASSNRLLTALALGLPTAADMLDSYAPLGAYFADLRSVDLDAMLDAPERHFPAIRDAQQLIAREHTLAAAQQRWSALLGQRLATTA